MLEGYDDDWTDYNTARKVQYTNLRPGSYRFQYAVSKDGQHWIEGHTAPLVTVERPVWQSPIFLSGLGIIILGTLGLIYNMRISHIKKESSLKEDFNKKLAENEMTALRAQMNPHFMFNSLNSIKNYILKENTDKASRYLTKFSQLMRAILKNSQSKLISLEDELHALKLYIEIESMRFNEAFNHNIEVDETLSPAKLYIPPLLIQPYVENAIWHGLMLKEGEKSLRLRISPYNGHLLITIEDNGIGRKKAAEMKTKDNRKNRSYGMQITRDRIELINKTLGINARVKVEDLTLRNGEPAGTKVHIYVPRIDEETYAATWER
jgi:LytS/YehU family sensor histidine kinase